ncbi:hypothetical protein FB446DRAFT_746939 [Lentinula raphanica]|nr:hypothetical protein FB446DRAFT_746939 [Lentinula raphanica]
MFDHYVSIACLLQTLSFPLTNPCLAPLSVTHRMNSCSFRLLRLCKFNLATASFDPVLCPTLRKLKTHPTELTGTHQGKFDTMVPSLQASPRQSPIFFPYRNSYLVNRGPFPSLSSAMKRSQILTLLESISTLV